MATNIVTLNVTQNLGATPSTLQKTGLIVSQGGTSYSTSSVTLLTQASDLTGHQPTAQAISTLVWATGTVTATTGAAHGYPVGQTIRLTISGAVPAGYNGTYDCTITGTTTFTYALVVNPGTETTPGTVIVEDAAKILADITTFFAQGATNAVYILELGAADAAHGVADLTTFLTTNIRAYYAIKVPDTWGSEATFPTLLASYAATTSMQYFFLNATASNYTNFTTAKPKSLFMEIQSTSAPATESSVMAAMWKVLNFSPSATNQVTPLAFSYQFGVTSLFTTPNPTLEATYKATFVNYITTGAEGGISNTILKWGTTADGRDFSYWYSVDWIQINVQQALANEIINGSNNSINPLLYNQQGINRLQTRAQTVVNSAVSFGLAIGPLDVVATGFTTYNAQNPNDYAQGVYNGLSLTYIPSRGFTAITFNISVSDFVLA